MDQLARIVNKAPWLITAVFVPVALILCMVLGTLTAYYMDEYELSRSAFVVLIVTVPLLTGIMWFAVRVCDRSDQLEKS